MMYLADLDACQSNEGLRPDFLPRYARGVASATRYQISEESSSGVPARSVSYLLR